MPVSTDNLHKYTLISTDIPSALQMQNNSVFLSSFTATDIIKFSFEPMHQVW